MRVAAALLVTAIALAAADGARAQARCPPVEPRVALQLDLQPAEVSQARSAAELRREAGRAANVVQAGLYQVEIVRRSEVDVQISQSGDSICAAVSRARIRVQTSRRLIYVASELAADSCRYRVTLEHERQHESIDEEMLRTELPARIATLGEPLARAGTATSVPLAERDRVVREVHDRAQEAVRAMFAELLEARERAQLALDTPQEYARIGARCR